MPRIGTISKYGIGVDLVIEWKIDTFSTLSETNGAYYYSPNFIFGWETWDLQINLNGCSNRDSYGHVDLGLYKLNSGCSIKQSFSLFLLTAKKEKYNEQHCMGDFSKYSLSHGCNRFILRSELTRRKSELMPKDVLTVVCIMKSSTSARSDSKSGSAVYCTFNSDFDEDDSSDFDEGCSEEDDSDLEVGCSECSDSLNIVKRLYRQKLLEEEFENPKEKLEAGNDSEYAYVVASNQHVGASTQREGASTLCVGAPTLTVEASTQIVEAKCEACASGSSIGPHDDELRHDLKELFLKKDDCDIIIKVKDSEFPAHRIILKARSPVFASTFRHDMKENATGIVEIDDCDPSSFSDFLCFLYCGDATLISQENVFGLFTAADKYQILNLRLKCLEFIKKNLTVDTFCETITLALRHSETELIKLCTDYFKKNVPKIIVTVKWQTFLAENPTESNELLVKFFVPNSS